VTDDARDGGFGFFDNFALWATLCATLYVMPFGALLVPALSIEQAIVAALIAGLLSGLLLAAIASLASRTGHSTAQLLAEPFGQRGRWPVALLLLARHVLFAAFALILIADASEVVGERALGVDLRPLWVLLFAAAGFALVVAGPRRVATILRRGGLWLVLLVAVGVAASAYMEFEIPSYLRRPAVGGWPSIWQAIDVMLIVPLLWLPVVADFGRLGRKPGTVANGTFAGVFLMVAWFGTLGIIYLPATESGDIPGFVVGMELSLGAIVLLFLLQADEVYASLYAAVPALESIGIRGDGRLVGVVPLLVAIPAALFLSIGDLEPYLLLASAVFIPAFGVVIAHALWPAQRSAAPAIVAVIAGFVAYQWISPANIAWWQDVIEEPFALIALPFPLGDEASWLGAAIPSFAIAFAIQLLGTLTERATEPASSGLSAAK
jgi:purine-cytosine permease-like protein